MFGWQTDQRSQVSRCKQLRARRVPMKTFPCQINGGLQSVSRAVGRDSRSALTGGGIAHFRAAPHLMQGYLPYHSRVILSQSLALPPSCQCFRLSSAVGFPGFPISYAPYSHPTDDNTSAFRRRKSLPQVASATKGPFGVTASHERPMASLSTPNEPSNVTCRHDDNEKTNILHLFDSFICKCI